MQPHPHSSLTRRSFIKTTAATAGVVLAGDRLHALAGPDIPRVVVAKGTAGKGLAEAAYLRTKAAVDKLGGMEKLVKGKDVFIKVNATARSSQDGNTSPAAASGLLKLVKECGAKSMKIIGQEWGGFDVPRKGQPTLRQAIASGGAEVIELPHYWSKTSRDAFKVDNPTKGHWHELMIAKQMFQPNAVTINLARLKTHPHCVYTGTLKNIIGLTRCMYGFHMVDDLKQPKSAGRPHISDGWHVFHEKLAYAYKESIGPKLALNILDAGQPTFGWRGPAPERIKTFDANTTVAGFDALAIDIVGCGILHDKRPKTYPAPLGDWSKGDTPWIKQNLTKRNYLVAAAETGAGKADLAKGDVLEIEI